MWSTAANSCKKHSVEKAMKTSPHPSGKCPPLALSGVRSFRHSSRFVRRLLTECAGQKR